ncbi:hypothetical protein GJ496_002512 [Pomphorhynchus laevis]|nr:hypothetical protein GJ496_002512 [Pomphorhynchus laevis]
MNRKLESTIFVSHKHVNRSIPQVTQVSQILFKLTLFDFHGSQCIELRGDSLYTADNLPRFRVSVWQANVCTRFEICIASSLPENIWPHSQSVYEISVDQIIVPSPPRQILALHTDNTDQSKLCLLVILVSTRLFRLIKECGTFNDAIAALNNALNKTINV